LTQIKLQLRVPHALDSGSPSRASEGRTIKKQIQLLG